MDEIKIICPEEELKVTHSTARQLLAFGELEKAFFLLFEVYECLRKLPEAKELEIDTLADLGRIHLKKGAFKMAEEYLREAIKKSGKLSYDEGHAYALNYLAGLERERGNINDSETLFLESYRIRKRIGELEGIATATQNLGVIYDDVGETDKALDYYREAIQLWKEIGTPSAMSGLVIVLYNIADIHRRRGEFEEAEKRYLEAKNLTQMINKRDGEALCTSSLGALAWGRGDLQKAKKLLKTSLSMWESLGIIGREIVENLTTLAGVYTDLEEYEQAEALLQRAENIADRELQSDYAALYVAFHRGYLEQSRGNAASAKKFFEICLDKAKKQNNFKFTLLSLIELAHQTLFSYRLSLEEELLKQAERIIQEILDAAAEKNMIYTQVEIGLIQGRLLIATMDYRGALDAFSKTLKLAEERKLPKQAEVAKEQIKKVKRQKQRAQRLIKPATPQERIDEVRNYLAKYQALLKGSGA